jgi:RNA polymerase sigma-70 factor (ECF subfamily)
MASRFRVNNAVSPPSESSPRASADGESVEDLLNGNVGWLRGWLGARLSGYQSQDVDDLCQEVLLRALRGARRLRRRDSFPAWLYRIAGNVLRDHLRRTARRRKHQRPLAEDVEDPRSVTRAVDAGDEIRNVIARVLELPGRYREPMILRHVEDLTCAEIGRILRLSENAVQVRIFRARQMLQKASRRPRKRRDPGSREALVPPKTLVPPKNGAERTE